MFSPLKTSLSLASALVFVTSQPLLMAQSEPAAVPATLKDAGPEVSTAAAPTIEEMEARLQEMNSQLQSLSKQLEQSNNESRLLVEQTLQLLRQQNQTPSAVSPGPSAAAALEGSGTPPAGMRVNLKLPGGFSVSGTDQTEQERLTAEWAARAAEMQAAAQRNASDLEAEAQERAALQGQAARERAERHWRTQADRRATRAFQRSPNASASRTLFSGNGIIQKGETVEEFVLFSGNGDIQGEVLGDAVLMAGNLVIRKGARIGGDAVVLAGNLTVESGAEIDGNTVVTAGKLDVEDGALIAGDRVSMGLSPWALKDLKMQIQSTMPNEDEREAEVSSSHEEGHHDDEDDGEGIFASARDILTRFLLLSASGLLLMTFLPARTQAVGRTLQGRAGAAAVTGILAMLSLAPLSLLMTVSLVGIPLVPVLLGGAAFAVIMGLAAASLMVGRRLPLQRQAPAWLLAAGAAVLAVVSEIPVIGPLSLSILALLGLGAVLLSRFGDSEATADA